MLFRSTGTVDLAQVDRVLAQAERLLARVEAGMQGAEAGNGDLNWARVARGAVEYLVCVEDGEGDFVVGGLDDDEAVLGVVEGA